MPESVTAGSLESIPQDADRVPSFVRSLSILLRLLGSPVSVNVLFGGLANGTDAESPSACLRAAKRVGLEGHIVRRKQVEDISPLTLPCILLLSASQSCVLVEKQADKAVILLPEAPDYPKTVPLVQLNADYTGYTVFGSVGAKLDTRSSGLRLLSHKRWFWDVIRHFIPMYKHVLVATVIINAAGVATSLFAMNVYDRVVPNQAIETLWVLTTGVLFAFALDFILKNVRGYFVDVAGRNADVILSSKLVEKVLTLELAAKPESTGALVNNLREFESLREFFSSGSMLALADLPFLLLFLWLTFLIGGPLVFVPLAAVPILAVFGVLLQVASRYGAEEQYRQGMQKNALLVEMVNGLETLKTTSAESRMLHMWEQVADLSAESSRIARSYATLSLSMAANLTQLVSVGVIVWGVYRIGEGALTMGGLIACNILAGRAMAPLLQLSGMITRWQQSRMTLNALNTVMELPSENPPDQTRVDFGVLQPAFSFEDVTFSYPNSEKNSLHNISFTIRPFEKVGIIGRMGSGKSTIGKLMCGLYKPQKGTVRYGGVDISQLDTLNLRTRIGVLPQDVVLFFGSIRDNIALGDPSIDDKLVLRAAYLAGATDFIREMPGGFGAQVGERGMALSGGQRQAVALARTLLRDPEVLLIDEPTSNMDRGTEQAIKNRLAKITAKKTLVIITHRPSLLDLVDRIIVLDGGQIVADGPKSDILRSMNMSEGTHE